MIFVDTGAWFASIVPTEIKHAEASRWLAHNQEPLLTTDYVVDEVLTLLRSRGEAPRALVLGERLLDQNLALVHFLSETEIRDAWNVFRRFADKQWSFTDCTSKVVMERLGVTTAFAFDQHFRQFGTVQVVP